VTDAVTIQLVIFDMDGVIFEGRNFWLDLHRLYSTEAEALDLAERYLKHDYETLSRITTDVLWKGKSAAPFLDLVRQRTYQSGIAELIEGLRKCGVMTAIVSSGPMQLAARAQQDLGIDEIRANEVQIVDGRISGKVNIGVPDSEKGRVSLEIMRYLAVTPDESAAIGDSESDVGVAQLVGLPVAYDSDSAELDNLSRVHLRKGELLKLRDIVRQHRDGSTNSARLHRTSTQVQMSVSVSVSLCSLSTVRRPRWPGLCCPGTRQVRADRGSPPSSVHSRKLEPSAGLEHDL
jgi:phosphoserine phosphatase